MFTVQFGVCDKGREIAPFNVLQSLPPGVRALCKEVWSLGQHENDLPSWSLLSHHGKTPFWGSELPWWLGNSATLGPERSFYGAQVDPREVVLCGCMRDCLRSFPLNFAGSVFLPAGLQASRVGNWSGQFLESQRSEQAWFTTKQRGSWESQVLCLPRVLGADEPAWLERDWVSYLTWPCFLLLISPPGAQGEGDQNLRK